LCAIYFSLQIYDADVAALYNICFFKECITYVY
jgi:hypothetical protein